MSEPTQNLKKTALHAAHLRAGARMVPFGGWDMPVQYSGILEEHKTVRSSSGIFDISHMGEFSVRGSGATAWLNGLVTNDVSKLQVGQGQYSLMLNDHGGVIDDLIYYRTGAEDFFLVVNASKISEDAEWLRSKAGSDIEFSDHSDLVSAIALQGPQARWALAKAVPGAPLPARFSVADFQWGSVPLRIARTGYTGEDGVELFFPNDDAEKVWDALISAGAKPIGLGARDTLRLEACYPLNGQDLTPDTTPIEAGLSFAVNLDKGHFTGRDKLAEQKASGTQKKLVAFALTGKGAPPRPHHPVYLGEEKIGEVTSGTFCPTLAKGAGLALISSAHASVGQQLELLIRDQRVPIVIEKKPLYKSPSL